MTGRPAYLRAGEIARRLDVSVRTVRRWIADETLPSVKIAGARLVAEAVLERRLLPASDGLDEPEAERD